MVAAALRVVGNIVTGDDTQTQVSGSHWVFSGTRCVSGTQCIPCVKELGVSQGGTESIPCVKQLGVCQGVRDLVHYLCVSHSVHSLCKTTSYMSGLKVSSYFVS